MLTIEEFLIKNKFPVKGDIDRDYLIRVFVREMDAGLNEKPSSLLMVNTYVHVNGEVEKDKKAVVLDAGGTNFRGALVSLPVAIEDKENRPMPGSTREVSEDEFYEAFANEVKRLKPKATAEKIGWCFSYPAVATEDNDAKLITWTKGIKAPQIVGEYVGAELVKRLGGGSIAVVNDTVATLLAGKAVTEKDECSSYIGFILGTGTNCAYVEKELGGVIINAESGAFDKVERSEFDKSMDAKTAHPGKQLFEKMIAGAYLGPLALEMWKAAAREGFFTPAAAAKIGGMGTIETIDVDNFCISYKDAERVNPLEKIFAYPGDANVAKKLAISIFERAAILTAIHLAAFAIKSGEGVEEQCPIAIIPDGSTWYKTKAIDFADAVKRELDVMLIKKRNIHYKFTKKIEDAPMIGAAIAALMK